MHMGTCPRLGQARDRLICFTDANPYFPTTTQPAQRAPAQMSLSCPRWPASTTAECRWNACEGTPAQP